MILRPNQLIKKSHPRPQLHDRKFNYNIQDLLPLDQLFILFKDYRNSIHL
jgi:hypothetical protein